MSTQVIITSAGRSGTVEYREGRESCRLYWEFGGGDVLAILSIPSAQDWDRLHPWAQGRRQEILRVVALETQRQRAPRARIEWDEVQLCIYFRQ